MLKILIVNPLSSLKYLSDRFKQYNFYTIALYTLKREEFNLFLLPDKDCFNKQIHVAVNSDIDTIIASVSDYEFDYILNGADESLLLTEEIIQRLKPELSNVINLTNSRINKFTMQERFQQVGLPYIKQTKFHLNDLNKPPREDFWFPCFIKPIDGGGSVGIAKCNDFVHMIKEISASSQLVSALNTPFQNFIMQEIIEGQEIIVDSFSIAGEHYISSVQIIHKQNLEYSISCYRFETIVYDTELWDRAVAIVKLALNACGFKNGLNHTELFLLKDNTFRIIEINPRISGGKGMLNRLAEVQGLYSQIDLLAMHLNNEKLKNSTLAMVNNYAKLLYLFNFTEKPTQDIQIKLAQLNLYSEFEAVICSEINQIPQRKKNILNLDAFLLLSAKDNNIVDKDASQIFKLEQSGELFS